MLTWIQKIKLYIKSTTVLETEYQPKTKELQLKSGVNMNTKQQTTQLEIETTIAEPTNWNKLNVITISLLVLYLFISYTKETLI